MRENERDTETDCGRDEKKMVRLKQKNQRQIKIDYVFKKSRTS